MNQLLLTLLALLPLNAFAQDYFVVEQIEVTGNRKTKDKIIIRELTFGIGDTLGLDGLEEIFAQNQFFLKNTGLFNEAIFTINQPQKGSLTVAVNENFFIYPLPIFELADRNFNVWWVEQNHDLRRINLGLRTYHLNLTGRRDKLKLVTQFGYTRKLELEYNLPNINRAQTLGLELNIFRSRNQEIPYQALANQLLFHRSDDEFLYRRFRTSAALTYRPKLFTTQTATLFFHQNNITDFVKNELNPNFFLQGKTRLNYFALQYDFIFDNRDLKPYPLTGNFVQFTAKKDGLGVFKDRNALRLTAKYARYFNWGKRKKWSTELIVKGSTSLIRAQQPYYDNRALGYEEDFIRGYEYYIMDGLDYVYNKASLRYQLYNGRVVWKDVFPLSLVPDMDLRSYLVFNNDLGYVNSPYYGEDNFLNNAFLWGKGFGVDIIVFYGVVIQLEYSLNHELEHGFFLHYSIGF